MLAVASFLMVFGCAKAPMMEQKAITQETFLQTTTDSLPPLNAALLEFVDLHRNKKVGNGECADLATKGLQTIGAQLPRKSYAWGAEVSSFRNAALPGDILQFSNVILVYEAGGAQVKETMQLHTAIIYEVKAPGVFVLAHQNVGDKRKVVFTEIDLKNLKRGKIVCYRPVN